MIKKTLEQYEKEFSEIPKLTDKQGEWLSEYVAQYEKLAHECIADFPNEKLGYIHLGISYKDDDFERLYKYHELSKTDDRYVTSSISVLKNHIYVPNGELPELLHREEKPIYAELYFLCGEYFIRDNSFGYAAEEFGIANKLGIDYKRFIDLLNPPVGEIEIKKLFCINQLSLKELDKQKEIYFLGENGVGKTLLLQAIVLGIIQDDYAERSKIYNNFPFKVNSKGEKQTTIFVPFGEFEDKEVRSYQNIFAYGVGRFITGLVDNQRFSEFGLETIFEKDRLLTDTEWWLKDLQRKDFLGNAKISLNKVIGFLEHILNIESNNQLKIHYDETSDRFLFFENDTNTEFRNLADGYRSVLILLCDLLRRLTENQPYITDIKDFYGIVLVDEIDMFLHPKWEYKIARKLRDKLPNIQWFFTTHSPMLILGASEDAVFYKIYKENRETQISEAWHTKELYHLLANGIITSPLFEMENVQMNDSPIVDTSISFWHSEINKKIKQRVETQRKTGKSYFSKDEIDEIVEWAITEVEEIDKI